MENYPDRSVRVVETIDCPESSFITRISYDRVDERLIVTFMARAAAYAPVPPDVWRDFAASPSKGAFFNRHVRTVFPETHPGEEKP